MKILERVCALKPMTKALVIAVPVCVVLGVLAFARLFNTADDALATWIGKDGTEYSITRAEAYMSMGQMKDRMLQDKAYQKNHLDNMLFQRLQAMEAIDNKLNLDPGYVKRTNEHMTNNMLIPELLQTLFPRESLEFSLEARKVRMILVKRDGFNHISEPDPNRFKRMADIQKTITNQARLKQEMERLEKATITKDVKKTDAEMAAHETNIQAKAQSVLAMVKKPGADFADIAKQNSDHPSASEGGQVGYVLPRSRSHSPQVMAAIAKLKVGEISGVINTHEGFVIVKVDEIATVTEVNLGEYYTDEGKKNFAKNEAWFASVWSLIDKTIEDQKGKSVFVYRENLVSKDSNALVFEVKHPKVQMKITRGDLLRKMGNVPPPRRSMFGVLDGMADPAGYSADEMWNFFEWEMSFPILKLAAWLNGIVESDAFQAKLRDSSYSVLASMLSDKRRESATVTDEEISAQYDRAKASYVKRLPGGATEQLSLDEAKEQIRNELRNKKINDSFHNWKNELFTRYQAKIHENRFEVIKPEPPKQNNPQQANPKNGNKPDDGKKNSGK
ncbi:MAG TPA: peptidylprolyl isomerase [Spirochaetota bacterium]|nr:peptidylprolyl isomerase [Spirochaetota bacterium]HPH01898.1 peptidylprolyl isomerase [Spirochaetota bacterium]HPN81935.1 peptidylprolyl isomerase [Spirochaetota bacterium]